MMNMPSILVIDSGIGGLSICRSILAGLLKDHQEFQIIYFADDAYAPYGLLGEEALAERLQGIVSSMLSRHKPDLVVLACNTVSTLLLPLLREKFAVPFVGVVPAIKPAAKLSTTKMIGLLATPATVRRQYTDALIASYAANCEVIRVGSSELVMQAEALLAGKGVCLKTIETVLQPFITKQNEVGVDTIVLGCTHFPFLLSYLQTILPFVTFIDSGAAIAMRVHDLLNISIKSTTALKLKVKHQIYFSGALPEQESFKAALCEVGLLESDLLLYKI